LESREKELSVGVEAGVGHVLVPGGCGTPLVVHTRDTL
jgi:hypothetical protein